MKVDCPKCGMLPLLSASAETIKYIENGQNKEIKVVVVQCNATGCGQPFGVLPA